MEIDTTVDCYEYIIFGGRIINWRVESDRITWNEYSNILPTWVAAMTSFFHEAIMLTENLLKHNHAWRDVHL